MCRYVLEERDCCHFHKGAKIIFHNSLESTISYYHKGDMITRLDYHGKRQRLNIGGNSGNEGGAGLWEVVGLLHCGLNG